MPYEVHLQQFDGPLDLLLHLIEQAEVDIKDIFISEITAQYLAYMEELDALDMETASEFLTVAATLIYIKSRSLLPRPPREETEEEDPEAVLIRQLREYKAFKEASSRLEQLFAAAQGAFTKLPEEFVLPPQEINLTESSVNSLFNAFLEVLNKEKISKEVKSRVREVVSADLFTVRAQLRIIRDRLREKRSIDFMELFSGDPAKMEMVVTFMALLDMLVRHEVSYRQEKAYGPITLVAEELIEDDADIEYMDEQ